MVQDGRLEFEDLGFEYGFNEKRAFTITWSAFDNDTETHTPMEGALGKFLPEAVKSGHDRAYFAARLQAENTRKTATVYLRRQEGGFKVVGVDRTWQAARSTMREPNRVHE